MDDLKALVDVVSKNKIKNIEIIGNLDSNPRSKIHQLYQGIAKGKFLNEESAASYFFEAESNRKSYFNRLKRKLKNRLINTLFFIDVNKDSFTEFQKAYYTCYKNSTAVKVLIGRNARLPAIELAEKTVKKALHFEFTEIVVELSRELRMHYSNIVGNKKKARYYNLLVNDYSEKLVAELKAEEYYNDIIINFVSSSATRPELADLAKKYSSKLREITKKLSSYRLNLTAFIVFSLRYEIINDYAGTAQICEEALQYYETKNHLASKTVRFTFLFKLLSCFIQLKKYEEGEEIAKKAIKLTPEGNGNWFRIMDNFMILLFHSNQLQKAYFIYQKTINHPNFRIQYKNISEHWKIHEAFIYYFILTGKITPEKNSELKKFRISKFLNDVPTYSKDKRGTNTSILILQILFLLQQEKYSKIIDRMEAI